MHIDVNAAVLRCVTRRNTDRRHHRPSRRHTAAAPAPDWWSAGPALWRGYLPGRLAGRPMGPNVNPQIHRPNSGTRPTPQGTAFQRHSGAAGTPLASLCCGGSPGTTRPVRRGRPPDRQGPAVWSRLTCRSAGAIMVVVHRSPQVMWLLMGRLHGGEAGSGARH
jgi:hypothetical protein